MKANSMPTEISSLPRSTNRQQKLEHTAIRSSLSTPRRRNWSATRKNNGKEWRPKGMPEEVNAYDFLSEAKGKAIPYGIYDLNQNEGIVTIGTTCDTATFAVA